MHVRRRTTEPSGCRDRSTACCVERRQSSEHIVVTVPTGTGDGATADGGGSIPGMDICKAAALRLFFLAIVDLFYVRERVARQRACPTGSVPALWKGEPSAWLGTLRCLGFCILGRFQGLNGPGPCSDAFRSANRLSVTPVQEFGRSVIVCNWVHLRRSDDLGRD